MIKSKMRSIVIVVLSVVFCLCLTAALLSFIPRSYSAGTNITATQDVSDGVMVYVSGKDVEKTDTGWYAPVGARVTVTVVNENRLFESMTIGDGSVLNTPVAADYTVGESELKIDVRTKSPVAENKGEYFGNPFFVSSEDDAAALVRIFHFGASDSLPDSGEEYDSGDRASDYAIFGLNPGTSAEEKAAAFRKLQFGYYRLSQNLFVNGNEFTGIGSRANPFHGCFDFSGYSVYLNVSKTEFSDADFEKLSFGENAYELYATDFGFFSYLYGKERGADGIAPCLIRNADFDGNISINTLGNDGAHPERNYRISLGSVAGTIGKNVVLDGITSQVSVSAMSEDSSLYVGGIFGMSSANVDAWSDVAYKGLYGNISGITYGDKASAYAGGLAGVVQNAYVNHFTMDISSTSIVANCLDKSDIGGYEGEETDSAASSLAASGGLAGVMYIGDGVSEEIPLARSISVKNISLNIVDSFSVTAVIDNAEGDVHSINPDLFLNGSEGAVSGGVVGLMHRTPQRGYITISSVSFTHNAGAAHGTDSKHRLHVLAQTQDEGSVGSVFAGGFVGYVSPDGVGGVKYQASEKILHKDGAAIFRCAANVEAVQNGVGPAYAGGLFGYNAFQIAAADAESERGRYYFRLCDAKYDFIVRARQTGFSQSAEKRPVYPQSEELDCAYHVYAGGFASVLPLGYTLTDLTFIMPHATVSAEREAGSTAVGDIAAGGFAAVAANMETDLRGIDKDTDIGSGLEGRTHGGRISGVNCEFSPYTVVQALGYAFESQSRDEYVNNVFAGGAFGHVVGYEVTDMLVSYDYAFAKGERPTDDDGKILPTEPYAVRGTNNAMPALKADGKTGDFTAECSVGGIFGLTRDCTIVNAHVIGAPQMSSVYLESANSPISSNVGGLAGACWSVYGKDLTLLDGATVTNVRVRGKAYNESNTENNNFSLYAGGVVGNAGEFAFNPGSKFKNIAVRDGMVEGIGENQLTSFAGGVFGNVFNSSKTLENVTAQNVSVLSSSVSAQTYAGGIFGSFSDTEGAGSRLTGLWVKDVSVSADSVSEPAYAAGVAGLFSSKGNSTQVKYCFSDAVISVQGKENANGKPLKAGLAIRKDSNNLFAPGYCYFVYENAGTEYGIFTTGGESVQGNSYALAFGSEAWKNAPDKISQLSLTVGSKPEQIVFGYSVKYLKSLNGKDEGFKGELDNDTVRLFWGADELVNIRVTIADTSVVRFNTNSAADSSYIDLKGIAEGLTYVSFNVQIGSVVYDKATGETLKDTEWVTLYSCPVKVDKPAYEYDIELQDKNNEPIVVGDEGYAVGNIQEDLKTVEYHYLRKEVGNSETSALDEIHIRNGKDGNYRFFPITAEIYEVSVDGLPSVWEQRPLDIVKKVQSGELSKAYPSTFSGRLLISYLNDEGENAVPGARTDVIVSPLDVLDTQTIVVFAYKDSGGNEYYVIIEYIPNSITGVEVEPSAGTPPMEKTQVEENGKKYDAFVYAPGDVVRLDSVVTRKFDTDGAFVVNTVFTDFDGQNLYVRPNGTLEIPLKDYQNEYKIRCSVLGAESAGVIEEIIYISVREDISVNFVLTGALVESDRKMVRNTPYTLSLSPQPGYGLLPEITLNGNRLLIDGQNLILQLEDGRNLTGENAVIYSDESYHIDLPSDWVDYIFTHFQQSGARFEVVYSKVFTFIFLSNYGDNAEKYVMTVQANSSFSSIAQSEIEKFKAWKQTLFREGFDLQGFYSFHSAKSLSAYGKTFEQMVTEGGTINGSMRFYARWTYNIAVKAPDGVDLNSTFAADMLQTGVIPMDDKHGFGFWIETPAGWAGKVRFDVYMKKNGAFERVTGKFSGGSVANSYVAAAEDLAGYDGWMYIVVYADSLEFYVGDAVRHDTDKLYADGVFTAEYNVNYGEADKPKTEVLFDFGGYALPQDTSLRLYYQKDGKTVWSGGLALSAERAVINIDDFISMTPGGVALQEIRGDKATSETFILVITLPNNRNNAGGDMLETSLTVSGYEYLGTVAYFGEQQEELEKQLPEAVVPRNEKQFTMYRPTVREVSVSEDLLTYSVSVGATAEGLQDYRHEGVRYMWRIETKDGAPIDKNALFAVFGEEIVRTTTGVYYMAAVGQWDIADIDFGAYSLSLLEVRNPQYPSEGLVLWTYTQS